MPLIDVELLIPPTAPPGDIRAFLREAERRIEEFQREGRCPAFVASDYSRAYAALRALDAADLAPGRGFCEWGSGFGVVAGLAAMLGFDACGIEVEEELVEAARQLAADFDLPVEFVHGSFIPEGGEGLVGDGGTFSWLTTDGAGVQEELGLAPDGFDVIFAYPWPDEERLTRDLFEHYAAPGALLVSYHGCEDFRVQRKVRRKPGGR
jgi:hypothetical protein